GANLTLANGDVIWGLHRNIGTLTIPSGVTVTIKPYNPNTESSGELTVIAHHVAIAGTLTGDGAGFTGGGGRGAQGSHGSSGNDDGFFGLNGSPRYFGYTGATSSPASGDGPAGGAASASDSGIRNGGYDWQGANHDDTDDTVIFMGSGGAGGFPTAPINDPSNCYLNSQGGNGGNGGGPGGASISITALESLNVTGNVYTTGSYGLVGNQGTRASAQRLPICDTHGGNGGNGGNSVQSMTVATGTAGAGAGGGCQLICCESDQMSITGNVDARGGDWRKNASLTTGVVNGGTVKMFFLGSNNFTGNIVGGNKVLTTLPTAPRLVTNPLLDIQVESEAIDANSDTIIDAADAYAALVH
ncbi:MAG: hypothetical protein ABI579_00895, partial [Candidatus Sumerlaeota bacterium]